MSQSRLENSISPEHPQEEISQNQSCQSNQNDALMHSSRPPGRPRGRGRPKLSQRAINKKKNQQQQQGDEPPKTKQRPSALKQINTIEGYIRIIDYLKKIQCDQNSFQNKMNPYHSLTASCFWYMVSAEYFSYDFFSKNNPYEAANHILSRVSKLPIQMVTRFMKNAHEGAPLQFQTPEVKRYGIQLSQSLDNLIALPLTSSKPQNIQKRLPLTTVAQDNLFISSTRATLFNFVKSKIQKSDKWSSNIKNRLQAIQNLEPKERIVREQSESDQNSGQLNIHEKVCLKQMTSDQVLLSGILNLPLDKVISVLQSTIPKIELPQIYPTFMPIPKADPLDFVFQLHQQQQGYLQYLKQYQKKMYQRKIKKGQNSFEQEQRQIQFQDAKCQICTDGDYTDDNLIVFCSTCNISLHQRCVGLAKVPAQSWVCDVCMAFGPAGINLPCPLCNVKGGAMKRTNIHIDSNLFKETNPGYYQYSKKCPYNKQKQEYIIAEKISNVEGNTQNKQQKQELYYDYFNKTTYPNDQPVCHYVWVHYVCSIWVPQCYFQQKNGVINVKGIQNIQKKRYKHECFCCKKVKAGASVKCEDPECKKYFHPECARKKKVYMQQLNLQKIKYLVFCEQHQPLKITRQIQYKKKKNRDQIIKFARMIEKYVQTYKIAYFPFKLMKIIPSKSFIQTFESQQKQQQPVPKPQIIKQTDEDFIKEVILKLSTFKKITVTIIRTQTGIKIQNIYQPSRRQMRKCLNKYDQFWQNIQNGQTAEQNCRRYDRIIKQNAFLKDKMEIFLNGGSFGSNKAAINSSGQKIKKTKGRKKKEQVQTLIEQEGGIFCICRKPYENQLDMLQCQICGEWYHFRCIGFIGNEVEAQTLTFHCMKCMKFQTQQQKRPRLQKCIHLFSADSLYLNYSPPTPKLLSQQSYMQIKQNLMLEEKLQQNEQIDEQKGQIECGKQEFKQNKSLNISNSLRQHIQIERNMEAQNSPIKDAKRTSKSQRLQNTQTSQFIKSVNLSNLNNSFQVSNTNAESSNTKSKHKGQTTLTHFIGHKKQTKQIKQIKQGKEQQQIKESTPQGKKNSSSNYKQKFAELQRSVLKGQYNGLSKK